MDLIEFMWDLVNHPEQLDRYKQDPAAYLEREGTSLSGADKHLLLHFSSLADDQNRLSTSAKHSHLEEISTVTRFIVNPLLQLGGAVASDTIAEESISLHSMPVTLNSRGAVFLAEKNTPDENGLWLGVSCRLLPHSYISLTNGVFFDLRLCYSGPSNIYDAPMVLHIKTCGAEPAKEDRHYLHDVRIQFFALDLVLLKADVPVCANLDSESCYYPGRGAPGTGTLVLHPINCQVCPDS